MMERDCRERLQFYTDLTESTVKLVNATSSFVSNRTSEREGLVGKLEAEKKSSAIPATLPRPRLTAKPLPRLPPFKSYNLDGGFDALKLGRESPQQTKQQWQNNGGIPSSPPPPSAPNTNSHASVSSPAPSPSPYTQYPTHNPTLPPPTSSPPRSSFFPPPPLPPSFSSISQPGQGPWGFLERGSHTPVQPPAEQNISPQPLSGQGTLPPPLGQSVLPPQLPTMAHLERRQPPPRPTLPAAVSPVQSSPTPPQQSQQQQQQEEYEQQPHLLYQFNRFVGHASQGIRSRRNSEWSQVTGVSDETRVSRLQGDGRTVGLRTATAFTVYGRKRTAPAVS